MKVTIFSLCVLLAAGGAAFGAGPSVTLVNNEPSLAWYVVDPPELASESLASPTLESSVSRYLAATGAFTFSWLAPEEQVTLDGLSTGTHMVLVVFDDGTAKLPARVVALDVDPVAGSRTYGLVSDPALLVANRGEGRLEALGVAEEEAAAAEETPPAIEEAAAAAPAAGEELTRDENAKQSQETASSLAQAEPALPAEAGAPEQAAVQPGGLRQIVALNPDWDPGVFSRESGGKLVVLPTSDALGWGMPGTRIESVSGVVTAGGVTLDARSWDGFSDGISLFLYVFLRRSPGQGSPYTVELHVSRGRAVAAVWEQGNPAPRRAGTATLEGDSLVWNATAADLPVGLVDAGAETTVDLTTAWLDAPAGNWEEFYVTTFALADIIR